MADLVGTRLGEFEVVRELGRGGMGVVYEAVQTSLGRRVALKVLGPGLGLTPRAVDRFRREAAAAARLHHSNIVPVYATGEQGGTHFYAMELIDGPGLDRVIRDRANESSAPTPTASPDPAATIAHVTTPVSRDPEGSAATAPAPGSASRLSGSTSRFDAARMIADVADALHHAHSQGVTHRDIKPSNLLLGSDGRLSVTDFGLARMLEQPGMTVTGEFVGTPAYMSPEQITAGRVPVDHRTDIYSLGATLYELLTLRPPFSADGRDRLLAMVIQKEPAPPRSLDPKVPRDLETICLKCLEKDPDRRYQSAKELADDLRRYVNRFAILAKRTGPLGRLRKWVKRNPVPTALLGCLLAAVLTAGFFAWQVYDAEQRRIVDEKQREEETRPEKRRAALELAMLAAMAGDLDRAEKELFVAEQYGAGSGQGYLIRGLVALYRGDLAKASRYLVQAVELMPASVSAQALLAVTYAHLADLERYEPLRTRVERLEPVTPEDALFQAYMLGISDPAKGLDLMKKAYLRRPTNLARAMRGETLMTYAMLTGTLDHARAAVAAARELADELPDAPITLAVTVMAHLMEAAACERAGLKAEREKALAAALPAVEKLGLPAFLPFPIGYKARYCYFEFCDDLPQAEKACRDARKTVPSSDFDELLACLLFRRGESEEAVRVLAVEGGKPATALSLRYQLMSTVLTDLGQPDEADRCYRDAEKHAIQMDKLYLPNVLRFQGRGVEADAAYKRLLPESDRIPFLRVRQGWYLEVAKYNAGVIGEDDLLRRAGGSMHNTCEAHFFIGMHYFGQRRPEVAKTHFKRAAATRILTYGEYWWSRAFLDRMKADDQWPGWLRGKK